MRPLPTILLAFCSLSAYGQKNDRPSIEFTFTGRWDEHAHYVTKFGDVAYSNELKLYGSSYGAALHYKIEALKHWQVAAGVGYYRLGIDKIQNIEGRARVIQSVYRPIDYTPDSTAVQLSASKYSYRCVALSIGLSRTLLSGRNYKVQLGAEAAYLYTVAQHYTTSGGPFTAHNSRPFAFQLNSSLGVRRTFKQYYLQPRLILPIYQSIKKDIRFRENPDEKLSKWWDGYGASVTIGKFL